MKKLAKKLEKLINKNSLTLKSDEWILLKAVANFCEKNNLILLRINKHSYNQIVGKVIYNDNKIELNVLIDATGFTFYVFVLCNKNYYVSPFQD